MSDPIDPTPFSRPQLVLELPPDGLVVEVRATIDECAGVARAIDIPAVDRLQGELRLRRWGDGGVEVTGRVVADIIQTCVVSLEPVPEHIDAPVEVRFLPTDALARLVARRIAAAKEAGIDDLEASDAEDPDEFDGQSLDLGVITAEFMVINMDLYPRVPGAEFDAARWGVAPPPEEEKPSPFAALAALRKPEA